MNNCYTALLNILKEYSTLNRLQKNFIKVPNFPKNIWGEK
jgi:hypothetical protein